MLGMFWYLGNWFIYENKFKNKSSVLLPALILIISSWFRPHSPELTIVSCSLYPSLCFKGGSGNLKWYFLDISPSRESWQQPVRPINNEDQPRGCVGGWECWRAPDKLHVVASGGQGGSGTRCTHTHTHTQEQDTLPTFLQFACGALFITLYFQESQVELGFWLSVCR